MLRNNTSGDSSNLRRVDVQRPAGITVTGVLIVALSVAVIMAAAWGIGRIARAMTQDMDNRD